MQSVDARHSHRPAVPGTKIPNSRFEFLIWKAGGLIWRWKRKSCCSSSCPTLWRRSRPCWAPCSSTPAACPEVIEQLRPEDFYLRQNREIYETIYSMFNFSLTIDPVTVLEHMRQNGVYDENTSRNYILQLMEITPTAANVGEYVAIVKDKALLRRIAETAGDMTAMVQEGTGTGQEVLEAAEQRIYAIRQGRAAQGLTPISAVLLDVYDRLNELAASDAAVPGLSTGLPDLDLAISGLNKSDLILLAARPGMGKTSMALNILLHAGKFSGQDAWSFSPWR